MSAFVRLAVVGCAVLVLSGCIGVVPPPERGLSDAEAAQIRLESSGYMWEETGLPENQRPPDPPTEYVAADEWATMFVGCMTAVGYDNYTAIDGGYSFDGEEQTDDERIASYLCNMSYTIDYSEYGYYNEAQKDYLYDYYEQVLVPCLVTHGVHLFNAPSREKFQTEDGGWIPYFSVRKVDAEWALNDDQLHQDCPMFPPGIPDPGYFG